MSDTSQPVRRPVGVFDSGLGGLTVVRAMIDLLPSQPLVYFGDTGRFPYGPKPANEVLKYSLEIADMLVERDVAMIVVACNSATAAGLDQIQARVDIPVIGDAELIIGLEAHGEADGGKIVASPEHMGSIDSKPVRELVERTLEGGREAFERRRAKYGFGGPR